MPEVKVSSDRYCPEIKYPDGESYDGNDKTKHENRIGNSQIPVFFT